VRRFRLLAVVFAVLASALAVSVEIADVTYAHAGQSAELPVEAGAEATDGEEHPLPDSSNGAASTRTSTYPTLHVEPRPLIIDGRSFRPPLQYRLQA
jgi:hypothetical protein